MNMAKAERSPADIYDERFVPALFRRWGPVVTDLAGVESGMTVLDVGCGTGALTAAVAQAAGETGRTVGVDPNPEMLAVARRKGLQVEWVEGSAEQLPFEDDVFDSVVSQFAMMFFENRVKALSEMLRVAKPNARVAVAVCGDIETSPGYAAFARVLDDLFGREIGDAFRTPFVLGNVTELLHIASEAGIEGAHVERRTLRVSFASIDDMISTERACAWTLGGLLSDEQFELLKEACETTIKPFTGDTGSVQFDMPGLILCFTKT